MRFFKTKTKTKLWSGFLTCWSTESREGGFWEVVCPWGSGGGWTDLMPSLSIGFSSFLSTFPFFSLFSFFPPSSFLWFYCGGPTACLTLFQELGIHTHRPLFPQILHYGDRSHKIEGHIHKQDNIRSWSSKWSRGIWWWLMEGMCVSQFRLSSPEKVLWGMKDELRLTEHSFINKTH